MSLKLIKCIILLSLLPQLIFANIRLHGSFSYHMVVQQAMKIPVWGWATPGEEITIIGSWGDEAKAVAGVDSTWETKLKTPKAGGPFTITLKGENTLVIDDVLAGEVWLCTGQSNMDFEMYRFVNDARESKYQPLVEYMRNEMATANDPMIRHIEIPRRTSLDGKITNFKANWRSAVNGQIDTITAIGYFFAKELRRELNVPIGLVECAWGGTRIQPWLSEEAYKADEDFKSYFDLEREKAKGRFDEMSADGFVDTVYQKALNKWEASGRTIRKPYPLKNPEIDEQIPATLHNGMISAIAPFAIKGILWYQGESNSHYMEEEYEKYFRTLITSWRKEWNQGDVPFYWAQLASYGTKDERSNQGWAMVSDHQRRTLDTPNTGMAVLLDIGETKDVHPHNKMDAGKRLALWALDRDYDVSVPAVSGPLYKSHEIRKNKIIVRFEHVGTGLMVAEKHLTDEPKQLDTPLAWFEIAGVDGVWKSANARIMAKDKIEVSSLDCPFPVSVRYAWSSNPKGINLYNKEGLPASLFSTEK